MNKLKISPSGNNNVWEYENFGNESNKTIKYENLLYLDNDFSSFKIAK